MGQLVDGVWKDVWYDTSKTGGAFVRSTAKFRNWITADGAPGPSGKGGFRAESGRYHLYVSYACPWAHRTLIFRALKGLESLIPVSVVAPKMPDETGWTFKDDGSTGDALFGSDHLYEVYQRAKPAILEPIMKVSVEGPTEFQGQFVRTIMQRRGIIVGTTESEGFVRVDADVPLAEMFGYSTDLRSASQGKAEYTMEFARYAPVPGEVSQELRRGTRF